MSSQWCISSLYISNFISGDLTEYVHIFYNTCKTAQWFSEVWSRSNISAYARNSVIVVPALACETFPVSAVWIVIGWLGCWLVHAGWLVVSISCQTSTWSLYISVYSAAVIM